MGNGARGKRREKKERLENENGSLEKVGLAVQPRSGPTGKPGT
jgi:hypothetical protein